MLQTPSPEENLIAVQELRSGENPRLRRVVIINHDVIIARPGDHGSEKVK